MNINYLLKATVICLCYGLVLVECTISPSQKGKKTKSKKEITGKRGPIAESVIDRDLIEEEPSVKAIIEEHAAYYQNTSIRLFGGPVLAYVTPVSR